MTHYNTLPASSSRLPDHPTQPENAESTIGRRILPQVNIEVLCVLEPHIHEEPKCRRLSTTSKRGPSSLKRSRLSWRSLEPILCRWQLGLTRVYTSLTISINPFRTMQSRDPQSPFISSTSFSMPAVAFDTLAISPGFSPLGIFPVNLATAG